MATSPLSSERVIAAPFTEYELAAAYDEMFRAPGRPRSHYRQLYSRLLNQPAEELRRSKQEAAFSDSNLFNEFNTSFTDEGTLFLQSRRTGRWWMQLPDKKMIACSWLALLMLTIASAQSNTGNGFTTIKRESNLTDTALVEAVQKQTFKYFWDFAHPVSGMARERSNIAFDYGNE